MRLHCSATPYARWKKRVFPMMNYCTRVRHGRHPWTAQKLKQSLLLMKPRHDFPHSILACHADPSLQISSVRRAILHVQCVCRACLWRCSCVFARSQMLSSESAAQVSHVCTSNISFLENSAQRVRAFLPRCKCSLSTLLSHALQYETSKAIERPVFQRHASPRTHSSLSDAARAAGPSICFSNSQCLHITHFP